MFKHLKSPEAKKAADERVAACLKAIKAECDEQRKRNNGLTDGQRHAYRDHRAGKKGRFNNSNFGMGF